MPSAQSPILSFIDQMILDAGLDSVPDDQKKEYRTKLAAEAQKRIGLMALRHLDEESVGEFMKLLESNAKDFDVIIDFLVENVSEFDKKAAHELEVFANEFVSTSKKLATTTQSE